MIPEAAVEAAARASAGAFGEEPNKRDLSHVRLVLEAAYPLMLSHEREETRLAHVDAVVNAESLGKYEAAVQALRYLADNAERDRDYVKVVDASAVLAAIDDALGK